MDKEDFNFNQTIIQKNNISKKILKIIPILLDVLFPKFCLGCGKEGRYICQRCMDFSSESCLVCPICGQASLTGETHLGCKNKYTLDGLISIWDYDGIIKEAIRSAKYGKMFDIAKELTENSLKAICTDSSNRFDEFLLFLLSKNTSITFVPLFAKKERERGFNQSKIIAKEIGKKIDKNPMCLLQKTKQTKDQASLDKKQRFQNIKNVFQFQRPLPKQALNIENVVLVDDVFTTGATIGECCKALKQNGAKKVWGFALSKPG